MSQWHREKESCSLSSTTTFSFYLEAVFELLGDKVEDYGIDAGVDGSHVDAEVVEHQQETAATEEEHVTSVMEDQILYVKVLIPHNEKTPLQVKVLY